VDLKGIGIDQRYQGGIRHQDIRLIHVANDVAAGVQGTHRRSEIVGRAMQVASVKQRTLLAASQGIVIGEQRLHARHIRHEKANNSRLAIGCVQ
jgi:hypothetical protein